MRKILGVIPARLRSTRLPHKMLVDIWGRPLIFYTWRQAKKSKFLDDLIIATDSKEIYDIAVLFGAKVMMTSPKHRCGTERVAEAVKKFKKFTPDIIANIQGDNPLISPKTIDALVKTLIQDKNALMSCAAARFKNEKDINEPSNVKVIVDKNKYAIYFSRSVIPYSRNSYTEYLKNMGIFGFRREFLFKYIKLPQTPLELAESLEQLRALEHGYKIKVAVGDFDGFSVDVLKELALARKIIKQKMSDPRWY